MELFNTEVTVKIYADEEEGEEYNEVKITREKQPVNKSGETKRNRARGSVLCWKAAGRGGLAGECLCNLNNHKRPSQPQFPHL